jgi:hypothetical protein
VRRITVKAQQRHTLTPEEYSVIKEYKEEEIERLREKHRLEGLSQEERYLLEKMKESVEKESQFYEQMVCTKSRAGPFVECIVLAGSHLRVATWLMMTISTGGHGERGGGVLEQAEQRRAHGAQGAVQNV